MAIGAGVAILGAAAGFVVYNEVRARSADPKQPSKPPKQPFWNEWMDSGDMPATGNGGPNVDQTGRDIGRVTTAVAHFGTTLLEFIGGHGGAPDDNTVNSGTVGSGQKLGSAASATEDDGYANPFGGY